MDRWMDGWIDSSRPRRRGGTLRQHPGGGRRGPYGPTATPGPTPIALGGVRPALGPPFAPRRVLGLMGRHLAHPPLAPSSCGGPPSPAPQRRGPPTTTQHPRRLPGSPAPPEQRGDCPTLGIYQPYLLARRPDPGRFPAGVAARHQCSPGLGRARSAPIWPFPSGARASPIPGWPTQRPRSHNPSYQPGIPARQPAFPHLAATAAPSPLELRPFPVSVWLGTRPLRRPPCRMRHHWRPPGTSCTHRTRGRPHLPRGRCPRRGQRAALAHEPRGPGHRRTPDRSPRKRLAALARGSAGSRRDPRQPPWPHRTGAPRFRREPGRGDPGSLPAQAGTHLPRVFRLAPLPPNHLGLEVGGRWGEEAADFLRALAHARARTAPALLRSAAVQAYVHRWAGLLSVAAQRALAETLLELPAAAAPGVDGEPPPFAATLADVRWHERPPDSRLPRWPVWLYIASPNGKVHWRVRRRVDHAAGKKKMDGWIDG